MAEAQDKEVTGLEGIAPNRLFLGSCLSLIATAVAFGAVTGMTEDFKVVFSLSNTQTGWVGGAALWGFAISIWVFGPLCDAIGMGRLMRFALACHLAGPLLMIFARGFTMLYAGALVIAFGNGTVEAVCNPLIATIYPNKKIAKLSQFHMWFPGGIVIGGLWAFFINKLGPGLWEGLPVAAWQVKIALVLVPAVLYGVVFTGQKFPATERVQSGHSFRDMVTGTLCRPLFWILFICMSMTASLELGPGRWMDTVMKSTMESTFGLSDAGILVLVYGSGLMAILRFFAGPVVHKLSDLGLLLTSAILSGLGLLSLTYASQSWQVILAATMFYCGVCYFWPTMLGVTSVRVPQGGALALGLLGGWGMMVVGLVTAPAMGWVMDFYGHEKLSLQPTQAVVQQAVVDLPQIAAATEDPGLQQKVQDATALVTQVNQQITTDQALPQIDTAKALREIVRFAGNRPLGQQAQALINPADEYGGLMSYRWISALSVILVLVFGSLTLKDRKH